MYRTHRKFGGSNPSQHDTIHTGRSYDRGLDPARFRLSLSRMSDATGRMLTLYVRTPLVEIEVRPRAGR